MNDFYQKHKGTGSNLYRFRVNFGRHQYILEFPLILDHLVSGLGYHFLPPARTRMKHNERDLVSIVVPVYNGETNLQETLNSVYMQTYTNIELIVVDDGSTDKTLTILEQNSAYLRLIHQDNKGAAAARNLGVKEAKGSWIAFLDADDLWEPKKLERQMAACSRYVWSYTDVVFLGGVNNGRRDSQFTRKYQGQILEKIACGNFIGTSAVMVRRQAFIEAGGFDESLRSIQDWDLWVRLSALYEAGYLDEPLVHYRVHAKSSSRSTRKTYPYHMKVIEKIFSPDGPAASCSWLKSAAKAMSNGICSQIAEEEGDYAFALKCAANAARFQPKDMARWIRLLKSSVKFLFSLFHVKGYIKQNA